MLEAIDRGDPAALRDELGDLLLQVVFHAEIAAETGPLPARRRRAAPSPTSWCAAIPHVFADVQVRDADEVVRNWRRIKAEERRAAGRGGGSLARWRRPGGAARPRPGAAGRREARARRLRLARRARRVLAKVDEERRELDDAVRQRRPRGAQARELGDLLLTLASLARHLDVQAEMALRDATSRLASRVAHVEAARARPGGRSIRTLDDAERDRLWKAAKASRGAMAGPCRFDPPRAAW